MAYWKNPWVADVIPVDLDSLADAVNDNIEKRGGVSDGHGGVIPNFNIRNIWKQYGEKLDAYIFPLPRIVASFSFGVRYSDEDSAYYSGELPVEYHKKIRRI